MYVIKFFIVSFIKYLFLSPCNLFILLDLGKILKNFQNSFFQASSLSYLNSFYVIWGLYDRKI